jgi:predicted nucleic acid-binding protein
VNVYVDSSVVLRIVLGEARPLAEWRLITRATSSVLLHVECRRRTDLLRLTQRNLQKVSRSRSILFDALELIELVDLKDEIVAVASQAFPFAIRSLDAIHLATALDWQAHRNQDLFFATHDDQLAKAARRVGFDVLGA